MGNNRSDVENSIRNQFDWVVFDGEYSLLSVIAEGVADWATGGAYEELPVDNAESAAQTFGINLVSAMAQNGFNPQTDTIYGGTMTFQNWQDLPGGLQLPLPNKFVPYIGVKRPHPSGGGSVSYIKVTFKNLTHYDVAFFLNGGAGLNTRLNAGLSQSFNMVVDPGVQPIVGIYQLNGQRLNFTVSDGGSYAFIVQNGNIVNSFT
jgi:hypothetical protein